MKPSAFLFALAILALPAFPQAISTPGASTQIPNEVTVSTTYLYYNKMHWAGTWSSTATYNAQDVVLYSGAAYVSLQIANLNQNPASAFLYWVVLPGSGGAAIPSTNYLLKGNGSGGVSVGVYGDVFALFAGCTGTDYPGADGNCHAAGSAPLDTPAFLTCTAAGCGSATSQSYYPIAAAAGWTPTSCQISLQIGPTGSSVIQDVQYYTGSAWATIFGATKLVVTTGFSAPGVVSQSTFANGIFPLAQNTLLRAQVTQNDSGAAAQFGYVRCH